MITDGVLPGNKDQGYVLRRLLRRAIRYADLLSLPKILLHIIALSVIHTYESIYPYIGAQLNNIELVISKEELKFRQTLESGLKEFEKGINPFILATTYGFPIELTEELAKEKGITIDRVKFDKEMDEHKNFLKVHPPACSKVDLQIPMTRLFVFILPTTFYSLHCNKS